MMSKKKCNYFEEKLGDPDDSFTYEYTCVDCVMKQNECSLQEAKALIHQAKNSKARDRAVLFKQALENQRNKFPGMGRIGVRLLARKEMEKLLKPLAAFVARKSKQLIEVVKNIPEYDALLEKFQNLRDKR